MPSLLIRIEPHLLTNPDLDLRYAFPDRLNKLSDGLIRDSGFDYEDGTPAMLIFLAADNLEAGVSLVIHVLETEAIYGNRLTDAATVGTSIGDETDAAADFVVVYPVAAAGTRMG